MSVNKPNLPGVSVTLSTDFGNLQGLISTFFAKSYDGKTYALRALQYDECGIVHATLTCDGTPFCRLAANFEGPNFWPPMAVEDISLNLPMVTSLEDTEYLLGYVVTLIPASA